MHSGPSRALTVILTVSMSLAVVGRANAQQQSSDPGRNPALWAAIGGGIGFGGGLIVGLQNFDDATYAERKILLTSLAFAGAGATAGALLARRASPAAGDRVRDPLWNGMLIGAAGGAIVGMWYVPAANCKTDINPECPGILRIAVGIPAIAGGAAIGALADRLVKPKTTVAPIVGRRAIGVYFSRTF